jgi:hypothetical protein|tara:strand:- start:658 stop:1035 length:378 start_codon:yes stop_codon:yes gene_type:complete
VENQLVNKLIQNIVVISGQLFNVEFFDTLMIGELSSWVLLVANLAHDWDFRTVSLDVVVKLGSSHMLEFFSVADIASEFRARVLSMSLELSQSLPDNFTSSIVKIASMRELTEIDTVLKDLVDLL